MAHVNELRPILIAITDVREYLEHVSDALSFNIYVLTSVVISYAFSNLDDVRTE